MVEKKFSYKLLGELRYGRDCYYVNTLKAGDCYENAHTVLIIN